MKIKLHISIYSFSALMFLAVSTSGSKKADSIRINAIPEPYPAVSGKFYGPPITASPDPLVNFRWQNLQASDGLQIYHLKPRIVTSDHPEMFEDTKSLLTDHPWVTVRGKGSIRLDFGQVNAGWLEIDSPDLSDSIKMSISEFNEPAVFNSGAQHRIKTLAPVKYNSTYRLELNRDLYEGVRYGWIHVEQFSKPWHITGVRLVCQIKPTNYNGSFSCSDSLLTKIWYTGAYVVKLNLLRDYFGAILMERSDRHSWTGDAHPAQAASMVAFGNYDFVRKNIEYTSTQNNGIASYALLWVLSLTDYYFYTGDSAILSNLLENACNKLDAASKHYGTNPKLRFYGWDERLGSGFENADCLESQNAYRMLSIRTWREFAKAMEAFGRKDLAEKYQGYAESKTAELKNDRQWYTRFGIHSSAEAINAWVTNTSENEEIFKSEFSDRLNRLSYSPFNEYFIIQSMSRLKKYDEAFSTIRDCWGGQILYGGTCFFEVYRPSWNQVLGMNDAPPNNQCGYTSLAHPWGAGVTKWLSEEVLGIKPTSPGFKSFDIVPHLGKTLSSVSGKILTPSGEIKADFDVKTGKCSVFIPVGSSARVGIPKVGKKIVNIGVNGKTVWNGQFNRIKGIEDVTEDADFIYLFKVQSGKYDISVRYAGTTPRYRETSFIYPVNQIKVDTLTRGNWGGKFGSRGYVLCNYNGVGKDVRKFPSFVTSVTYSQDDGKSRKSGVNGNKLWAVGVTDIRALSSNAYNDKVRNIGCIFTQDPTPGQQTMTIDIRTNSSHMVQVALYFVDWDKKARRSALEIFDLDNKKLIAPLKIVDQYAGGKYLIFKYNKSMRLRINQIRGENAVLSGIFFD